MPSSVEAINSSRVPFTGKMLTLVMRISGMRFQLSARIVPFERGCPIAAAVSREVR
jgi:hypothetical protein